MAPSMPATRFRRAVTGQREALDRDAVSDGCRQDRWSHATQALRLLVRVVGLFLESGRMAGELPLEEPQIVENGIERDPRFAEHEALNGGDDRGGPRRQVRIRGEVARVHR